MLGINSLYVLEGIGREFSRLPMHSISIHVRKCFIEILIKKFVCIFYESFIAVIQMRSEIFTCMVYREFGIFVSFDAIKMPI